MALTWRPLASRQAYLDRVYELLNAFEPPTKPLDPHLVGANITIGIGFDLKAGGTTVQNAVFRVLGLNVDNTIQDPTFRQKEDDYIRQLRDACNGQ